MWKIGAEYFLIGAAAILGVKFIDMVIVFGAPWQPLALAAGLIYLANKMNGG